MAVGLVCLGVGCEPVQAESSGPPELTTQARAERLAGERGFDLEEATLVVAPGGKGDQHLLHLEGVPVWGLGAKTAHGETHFTNVRLAPGVHVETKPRISQAQAVEAALARLEDPTARLTGARLMLVPRHERRRRAEAPAPGTTPPNAAHHERVVTGFTLLYRLELATGDTRPGRERPWIAQVDARSGQVLRLAPLELDYEYLSVNAYGYYVGNRGMRLPFNTDDATYDFIDLHNNTYEATTEETSGYSFNLYYSDDAEFGDGQLFLSGGASGSVNGETAAVDAYWAVHWTWNLFSGALARNGPDGTGRPVMLQLHYPRYGAAYVPRVSQPRLEVGYRSVIPNAQQRLIPMTTTDILAHELGHDFFGTSVWANPADTDTGPTELAALNEATGDIIGFLTELSRYARGGAINMDLVTPTAAHFTLGEETGTVARNIYAPQYYTWFDDIASNGPHAAAGPITRMFVLLAYGCEPMPDVGSWTEKHCPLVPGGFVGLRPLKAARIWARTVDALPDGADFHQARELALASAAFYDGPYSGTQRRAVANAFAAVGIGNPPDAHPPTLSMTCEQVAADIECTGTISDAETPGQFTTPPQLVVGAGTANLTTYPLAGWQFTHTIPAAVLSAGSNSLQLKAWDAWNNEAILNVTVTLDTTGPEAWVTRSGPPKLPTFLVAANDPGGIARVEFLDGTQLVAMVMVPPYEMTFDTSTWTDGTHPMVIKAFDTFDNVTVLTHALLVDNTRPVVTMTVGTAGPPFAVSATAVDASALVRADLKVDGLLLQTWSSGTSYQAAYSPTDPLAHNLIVEVTDAFGNKGVATQAAPLDKTPPSVTFSAQQGLTSDMTLTVGVSDTCGIQYPYGVYVDGALVGQATTPGYVVVMGSSALAFGVHAFHALVTDGCGNTAQFQTTFAKVLTPPTISGITRNDTLPKKPKFTVQCNDFDGVRHVEMRENGVVVQTDTTAPYEFVVDTTTRVDGSYSVLFQCTDIHGASSSPETRTVTADNTGPVILSYSVYGAARSYRITANNVSDPRGVKNVNLRGGLIIPTFNATLTQAPYAYTFTFTSYVIKDNFPFWVTATDNWGNQTTRSFTCYMDTNTTLNKYLTCT